MSDQALEYTFTDAPRETPAWALSEEEKAARKSGAKPADAIVGEKSTYTDAPREVPEWAKKDEQFFPGTEVRNAKTGVLMNYGAGLNEDIANTAGAPVDLVAKGINKLADLARGPEEHGFGQSDRAQHRPPLIEKPFGGSESIKSAMGLVDADPREVVPANKLEQASRAAGEGTAGMLLPYGAAKAGLLGAGKVAEVVGQGSARSNATIGAAGGVGGQIAENQVDDPNYKPIANFTGQLMSGGLGAFIDAGATWVGRGAKTLLQRYTAPIALPGAKKETFGEVSATPGQAALAREKIVTGIGGESRVAPVSERLADGNVELVPGSKPTSFQATGDQQVGDLERWARNRNASKFLDRQNAQDTARSAEVHSLAPPEGGDVGAAVRAELDRIDQGHQPTVAAAERDRETAVARMGGENDGHGAQIRSDIESNYAPRIATADRAVTAQGTRTTNAVDRLGRYPEAGSLDQAPVPGESSLQAYGNALRGEAGTGGETGKGVAGQRAARKAEVGSLFDKIPKDLQLNSDPLRATAGKVRGMVDEVAGDELGAREKALLERAENFPADASFDNARAFRSNISAAIRDAVQRGGTTENREVARLTALKRGVDDAITATIEGRAKSEAEAVAAGRMAPEETMLAKLQAEARGFLEGQPSASGTVPAGRDTGAPVSGAAGSQPGGVSGASGAEVPPSGRPGSAARDQGLPGETRAVDPQTAADYKRAVAEYADYKQTYATGAVGDVLRAGKAGELYRLQDSQVFPRFWNKGKTAAEDVQSLMRATGSDQMTQALLEDGIGFDLRRVAEIRDQNGNGTGRLNRAAYAKYMQDHQEGFEALPDTIRNRVMDRFGSADRAQARLDELVDQRAALEKAYPLKPGGSDAAVAEQYWKPGTKGGEQVQAYMRDTGGGLGSMQNLADYAASRLRADAVNPDGSLNPQKYDSWMRRHDAALSAMPPELRTRFENVANAQATLDQANADRAAAIRSFERGAASLYLGGQDPMVSIRQAMSSRNPTQTIHELMGIVGNDPAALNGLRRDFMQYALRRAGSNAPIGGIAPEILEPSVTKLKPDVFQNFVKDNAGPIRELYGADGLQRLQAVAADLRRANLSVSGSKLPGGSDTFQNYEAATRHGSQPPISHGGMKTVLAAVLGTEGAGAIAQVWGGYLSPGMAAVEFAGSASAAIGLTVATAMRRAGIEKIDDLVTEAMLHPEIMQTLLAKAPPKPDAPLLQRFQGQMATLGVSAAANSQHRRPPVQPK